MDIRVVDIKRDCEILISEMVKNLNSRREKGIRHYKPSFDECMAIQICQKSWPEMLSLGGLSYVVSFSDSCLVIEMRT